MENYCPKVKFKNLSGQGIGHTRLWSRGGSLRTLTQEMHFPKDFLTKLGICQVYSKTLILAKEKLKNNVRFRKERRNINFHVASF